MTHFNQFPARVLHRETPVEQLQALAGVNDAFFWTAEISSDRLDAYFTRMAESTLRNFAADSQAGVTFLDSHNSRQLGYGQSLTGTFEVNGDISRVISDFYTAPGIRFGSGLSYESTDDFIKAVQARLVRDVSVGFYGGDMICDICGSSFYDWRECPHWPGVEYAIGDQGNDTTVATFEITDAHLAEVSAVYDGATPEAMVLKAREQSEAGEMSDRVARILEVRYRIKPTDPARSWPGVQLKVDKSTERSKPMPKEQQSEAPDAFEQIRLIVSEAVDQSDPVEAVRWLVGELARLQPLADDGQQYRSDLIDETLAEGVRASGDSFPLETYRGILQRATIEHIKQIRDDFAAQAKRRFPGGRATVDTDETEVVADETSAAPPANIDPVPDAAYVA